MNQYNRHLSTTEVKPWYFSFVLFIAFFLLTDGFYLKILEPFLDPRDYISIAGALFSILLCAFMWFKKNVFLRDVMRTKYGRMILLFFVLIIIPTVLVGGIITQRQPLIRPSMAVIRTYAGLLFFFWLAVYCRSEQLFLLLHRFIFYFGLVWIIISIVFYFFPDLIMLLLKTPGKDLGYRLDSLRFIPPAGARNAMMYTCFYALANLFKNPSPLNFRWIMIYAACLFSFLFALMIRRNVFVLIAVPIIFGFFFLNISKKVIISFFLINLVIISALMFSSFYDRVNWAFESVVDEIGSSEQTSTNVRLRAFNYYFPELVDSYYIGYGYYGDDKISPQHRLAYGHSMGYLETDLGILQALLMYGVPGLMWSLIMYLFFLKDLLNKKKMSSKLLLIRNTLIMNFMWLIITIHSFVWGYHQTFWWSIIIFMVAYLSSISEKKRQCAEGF